MIRYDFRSPIGCVDCGTEAWYRNGYGECVDCALKSGRPGVLAAVRALIEGNGG